MDIKRHLVINVRVNVIAGIAHVLRVMRDTGEGCEIG
jgi:hypothetical protein